MQKYAETSANQKTEIEILILLHFWSALTHIISVFVAIKLNLYDVILVSLALRLFSLLGGLEGTKLTENLPLQQVGEWSITQKVFPLL